MANIALYEKIDSPNMLANIKELGRNIAAAGLFGVKSDAQGAVMMLTCIAENMTPVEFGKTYHIIEGKLSMRADAMQGKFQESGGRIEWIQSDGEVCEARFSHKDYCPGGVVIRVTLEELVDSGVTKDKYGPVKDVYRKHPRQMLRARVISEGVRMVNPSIVAGYYTPEETADFERPVAGRGGRRAEPLLEPREADAEIVDEPKSDINPATDAVPAESVDPAGQGAANPAPFDLSHIEDDANAYLESVNWIRPGKTWRDLRETQKAAIRVKRASFMDKVAEFNRVRKENAHAV